MTADFMSLLQQAAGAIQRGDFATALRMVEAAEAGAPTHPEVLHMKALALGRLGRISEALPLFDRAAATHPQSHAILANKGNALRNAGRFADAASAYESALAQNASFTPALTNLGLTYHELGRETDARKTLERALALKPNDIEALNNLGVVLGAYGDKEGAIKAFSKALALKPQLISALVNRGSAYRSIGAIDKALADHQAAVELAPEHAVGRHEYANSLRSAGRWALARIAYAEAARLCDDPEKLLDIHNDFARTLWEMGDGPAFLDPLDHEIVRRPTASLLSLKAELALRVGMMERAEAAASAALKLNPGEPRASRIWARVRRQRGDETEGLAQLRRSLAAKPGDFDTLHDLAEAELAAQNPAAALDLLAGEAPEEHLQKHIALRATAMRLLGDDSYRRYYDYDRFVRPVMVRPPPGFGSTDSFNEALSSTIARLHSTKAQPIDQTLYGGTQSFGRLWDEPDPVIQALKQALLEAAAEYVAALPDDPGHPFLYRKNSDLECAGAWSVVLASGGGHVDHIHPKGWISASYYVQVPEEINLNGLNSKAGCLRLGRPPIGGVALDAEKWVRPVAGAAIFFPSYMWHGVEPFESSTPRITAPFDLAPRQRW